MYPRLIWPAYGLRMAATAGSSTTPLDRSGPTTGGMPSVSVCDQSLAVFEGNPKFTVSGLRIIHVDGSCQRSPGSVAGDRVAAGGEDVVGIEG